MATPLTRSYEKSVRFRVPAVRNRDFEFARVIFQVIYMGYGTKILLKANFYIHV